LGELSELCSWLAIFVVFAVPVQAQDAQWLQEHALKNRYEGLIDTPNAKRAYSVVGFFAFREKLVAHPQGELHVKYFLPEEEPVFIQSRQMLRRTNYLMLSKKDSVPKNPRQWNDFHWPAKDVIGNKKIDASSLGVVVRLNSDNEYAEEMAPAVFYNVAEPRDLSGKYQLVLKVQQDPLTHLKYEVETRGFARTCHYTRKSDKAAGSCAAAPAGEDGLIDARSIITLDLDLGPVRDAGEVNVQIDGEYKDSDAQLHATYRFYHQPNYR